MHAVCAVWAVYTQFQVVHQYTADRATIMRFIVNKCSSTQADYIMA